MKVKCSIPIEVGSGELPEVYKKSNNSIDVFCINSNKLKVVCYYNFTKRKWFRTPLMTEKVVSWLKETIVDIPTKEEREKELGDAIDAAIKFKWQGILIKKVEIEKFKTEYIQQQSKQISMSTSELFQKHFDGKAAVCLKHPNVEAFFEELNAQCLAEDKEKLNKDKILNGVSPLKPNYRTKVCNPKNK